MSAVATPTPALPPSALPPVDAELARRLGLGRRGRARRWGWPVGLGGLALSLLAPAVGLWAHGRAPAVAPFVTTGVTRGALDVVVTATGALERVTRIQFLIEAVVPSAVGGLGGIAVGLAGSLLGTARIGPPLQVDPLLVLLPFGFSGAVGVVFGFFPARKAARLNPIDALRHE